MSFISKAKDYSEKFEREGLDFFNYAEKGNGDINLNNSFKGFKKKKFKKSFNSEGLKL